MSRSRSSSSERSEQTLAMMARMEARAKTNQVDISSVYRKRQGSTEGKNEAIGRQLYSPGSQANISVDSSIMDPFKLTASSAQKQATRNALNHLVDDMSFDSSIHFDSSPDKNGKRVKNDNNQLSNTSTIEASVLMTSNTQLEKALTSSDRMINHLRNEKQKENLSTRLVIDQHARETSQLRGQLQQVKEDMKTEVSIRTEMQIKLNEAEATILVNQKLIRELKTDLRQKQKQHSASVEAERAERNRISVKTNSETRKLKNSGDILRQELHNERTAWALERTRLEKFNVQNETTIASLTMEVENLRTEIIDVKIIRDQANTRCADALKELEEVTELCDKAKTKSHEATLECDRVHILLADLKGRSELQAKTALASERILREKIETFRAEMQSLRVSALEASAASAEEVSRGHEVRQGLIEDLTSSESRVKELEKENKELMEATLQQDVLLNQSVNDSIDLGHRVMENDVTLASINEKQKNEIYDLHESMEIEAEAIRSSVEDSERKLRESFVIETEEMRSRVDELERSNKLLELEKEEFLKDMKNTIESVGQMESRLSSLIDENAVLKAEIKSKEHSGGECVHQTNLFSDSSLEVITTLQSVSSRQLQQDQGGNMVALTNNASVKVSDPQDQASGPLVVGRLERLERFIGGLKTCQKGTTEVPSSPLPTAASPQVVFNIEALLACLLSIKQESEEMVVHTSTVATTSLLRQLRHRKSKKTTKNLSSAPSTPSAADRIDSESDSDGVNDSVYFGTPQQEQQQLDSGQESPRRLQYPGNVDFSNLSGSESDDEFHDEEFEEKKLLDRQESDKSQSSRHSEELFTQMDSSGDGFISLPEFIKAVRSHESVGKALKLSCGTVIRQNDGSQDELVRLYNELLSDNTPGITYANFSRYLEEQDGDMEDYMFDVTAHHKENEEGGGGLNESFAIDTPLESLGKSALPNSDEPANDLEKYMCYSRAVAEESSSPRSMTHSQVSSPLLRKRISGDTPSSETRNSPLKSSDISVLDQLHFDLKSDRSGEVRQNHLLRENLRSTTKLEEGGGAADGERMWPQEIEASVSEQVSRSQVSLLTNALNELQDSYNNEAQHRKDLTEKLSRQSSETRKKNQEVTVISELNRSLQSDLTDLKHDYNIEVQRREAQSAELLRSPSRVGQQNEELLIMSRDYERLQNRLREVKDECSKEVQRRLALSRQLMEVEKGTEKSDGGNAQGRVSQLEKELLVKSEEMKESEESHRQHVTSLASQVEELQRRLDDSNEKQRGTGPSASGVASPAKSPKKTGVSGDGSDGRRIELLNVFAEEKEGFQAELRELRHDYGVEVQRRQALSRQLEEVMREDGDMGASVSNDKVSRLEKELLVKSEEMKESEESHRQHVTSLASQVEELQRRLDDSNEKQRGTGPSASGVASPAKSPKKTGVSGDGSDGRRIELLNVFAEEKEGFQAELRELRHDYGVEVQRRQALSRQLEEVTSSQIDRTHPVVATDWREKEEMLANVESSRQQVSSLENMLKILQKKFDDEAEQHQSLKNKVESSTSLRDAQEKLNTEVQRREALGQQLLEECSMSARRSEDAMETIRMLKETNRALEAKGANHMSIVSALESRCVALEQQTVSAPSSLLVASAELRVMQAKMIEFERVCEQKVKSEQRNSALRLRELETFMRKHEMEKAQLVERMNEQSQTVHHLTHHVHLLQSAQAELGNTTLPSTDIDLPAGTFGGQYPLFFKHSEENKVPSGDSGAADLWPLSDHIEQVNGANMSQLSASLGPDISFSTAPPPTRSGHYINPTHPATAVKGGMHGLQNDGMFQRCISRDALVMPEGAHRGTTVKTDEKTNQVPFEPIYASKQPLHSGGRTDPRWGGLSREEAKSSGDVLSELETEQRQAQGLHRKDSPSIRPVVSNSYTPYAGTLTGRRYFDTAEVDQLASGRRKEVEAQGLLVNQSKTRVIDTERRLKENQDMLHQLQYSLRKPVH